MLALIAPVFWSISGVTVRFMEDATEWQINFYRSGTLALFVLAVIAYRHGRWTMWALRGAGRKGFLGGACLALAFLCNIFAIKHTTVANAVLLMAVGPIIAAIFGRIFLNEHVGSRTWLAVALAALGVFIMVGGSVATPNLLGDLVALIGVLGFGAYAVVLRSGAQVDMTPAVLYAGVFSALAAGCLAFATGAGLLVSRHDLLLCSLLGVVQIGIGSLLFAMAARTVQAAQLTIFALGEPLLAPIWTWIGVGEVPGTATFAGGAVLLAALAFQATSRRF